MTPARPRLPAREVERLARLLHRHWTLGTLVNPDGWLVYARQILKHYVARPSRKRPAKTGKGKR